MLSPKQRKVFSPSRIMAFKKCPRRYLYNESNLHKPMGDKTALWFGKSVHQAIQDYYDALSNNPTAGEIKKVAEKSFNDCFDPRLSNRMRKTNGVCLDNFVKFETWRLSEGEKPFKPEVYEKDLASEKFHCYADWYHGTRIIDWKTGKNPKITEDLQIEMWVQAEVLEANGYKVESIQLCFLRFNKFLNLPKPNLGWLYAQRKEVLEAIELNYFPPKVSILCHWCPFKLRCEYDHMKEKLPRKEPVDLWQDDSPNIVTPIIPQRITHVPEW